MEEEEVVSNTSMANSLQKWNNHFSSKKKKKYKEKKMGWENCWVDFEKKNSKELSSMESSCTAAGHFDAGCFLVFF